MAKDQAGRRSRGRGQGGGRGGSNRAIDTSTSTGSGSDAPARKQLPVHWPSGIVYLAIPAYAGISPWQRQQLQTQPGLDDAGPRTRPGAVPLSEVPSVLRFGPSALVEIRSITDPAHPACGQHGLFAARDLAAGSFVLPYLGVYHRGSAGRGHSESDYDLWLDRDADVAVDAARAGNEARFINDYRGTGRPRPNAEFREVWDPRRGERGMAVFVLPAGKRARAGGESGSARGIARGDEILVSYGKGFWEMRRAEKGEGEKPDEVGRENQTK